MIKRVEHIAINTSNLQESMRFYQGILGLEFIETVNFEGFSISYLKLPGNSRLELFHYDKQQEKREKKEEEIGLRHIAFAVEKVSILEDKLRNAGVPILLPTTDIPSLKARVLLFKDPNGVTLEFCEALEE